MQIDKIDKFTIYRTVVLIVSVVLILWGCLVVLRPFIPAFLLAIILCLSTWPAFEWLQRKLRNRNGLAALMMTLFLAVCFLVPLIFLGTSLAENFSKILKMVMDELQNGEGVSPDFVASLPLIGPYLAQLWQEYTMDAEQVKQTLSANAAPATQLLIAAGASIGRGIIDLSLGVLIAYFFFRHGVVVSQHLNALLNRFIGHRGQHLLIISKKTMIGVVYGVLGTALAQGALAGIGFWIAGVPGAPLLGLFTLLLSFIPMGPPLIWVPATIWLFMEGHTEWGVFMGIWGLVFISMIDNVIRPYFISLGSDLPLLLVLLGVFGGIIAFGFIGLFIGPTLLAVAYSLIIEWSRIEKKPAIVPETIITP